MGDWEYSSYQPLRVSKGEAPSKRKFNMPEPRTAIIIVMTIMALIIIGLSTYIAVRNHGDKNCNCTHPDTYGWLAASISSTVLLFVIIATLLFQPQLLAGPHKFYVVGLMLSLVVFALVGWGLYARQFGDENCTCMRKEIVGWTGAGAGIMLSSLLFIIMLLFTNMFVKY